MVESQHCCLAGALLYSNPKKLNPSSSGLRKVTEGANVSRNNTPRMYFHSTPCFSVDSVLSSLLGYFPRLRVPKYFSDLFSDLQTTTSPPPSSCSWCLIHLLCLQWPVAEIPFSELKTLAIRALKVLTSKVSGYNFIEYIINWASSPILNHLLFKFPFT